MSPAFISSGVTKDLLKAFEKFHVVKLPKL